MTSNSSLSQSKNVVQEILVNPGTMGSVMHGICLRAFGTEFHDWEPETLGLEIEDEFGVQGHPAAVNRLNALVSAVVSDSFYRKWPAFAAICTSLTSDDGLPEIDGSVITPMLAWGVTEVLLNDSQPVEWSADVARYAGVVQSEDGLVVAMPPLQWADMPEIYRGSDTRGDIEQDKQAASDHLVVFEQFITEQSLVLFKQLSALPWMTPEALESMSAEIRRLP